MMDQLVKWGIRVVGSIGALYLVAVSILAVVQDKMVYVPVIPGMRVDFEYNPGHYDMEFEDLYITVEDGVKIHLWYMWEQGWTLEQRRERPVLLFFQENAGNLQHRLGFIREMVHYLQCSVLAVSYRGYGPSAGIPSEKGLQLDAQGALEYLISRKDVDAGKVVVYGRSLGGAVGIHLAARNAHRIRALIIENTFTSIQELVPALLPILWPVIGNNRPFNWLLRSKWNSRAAIRELTRMPISFHVSMQDEMVPAKQMLALYNSTEPVPAAWKLEVYPEAHHMDIYAVAPRQYWRSLQEFLATHVDRGSSKDQSKQT